MSLSRAERVTLFMAESEFPYPIRFEDLTTTEQAEAVQIARNLLALFDPANESTLGKAAYQRLEKLVSEWSQVNT